MNCGAERPIASLSLRSFLKAGRSSEQGLRFPSTSGRKNKPRIRSCLRKIGPCVVPDLSGILLLVAFVSHLFVLTVCDL